MLGRVGTAVALVTILAGTSALSIQVVGEPTSLTLSDPRGDSGSLPCSQATDLLELKVAWGSAGVLMEYTFRDLSIVSSPVSLLYDANGRCFYSYTDFSAELGGGQFAGTIYIDHTVLPIYGNGWRVYLYDDGPDLPANVDGNTIHVTVPYDMIGEPAAGDRIGDFRISATNTPTGAIRETDWMPDHLGTCGCWLEY